MLAKFLRLVRGRLWMILPMMAFGAVMAGVSWIPDRAIASWTEDRVQGYIDQREGCPPSLVFSPDGRSILTGTDSESGSWLRETETGRVLAKLSTDRVRFPTFFDNGRLLAGQTYSDKTKVVTVHVWEVATGRSLASFDQEDRYSTGRKFATSRAAGVLAIDPGMVTGPKGISIDGNFPIWDTAKGLSPHKFPGAPRCSFALSPDGRTLYLDSPGRGMIGAPRYLPVTVWDVETGKSLGKVEPTLPQGGGFDVDYDGRLLFRSSTGREDRLVDRKTQTSKPIPNLAAKGRAAFYPNGRVVIDRRFRNIAGAIETRFDVVELDASPPVNLSFERFDHATPDGRRMTRIYWRGFDHFATMSNRQDSRVFVLDESGTKVASLIGSGVCGTALSPDGNRVALLQSRREVSTRAWLAKKFPAGWSPFDPGPDLIRWSDVIVYEVDTGGRLATIPVPAMDARRATLTFSPSGDRLAVEVSGVWSPTIPEKPWSVEVWAVPARRPWAISWLSATASALLALVAGRWLDGRARSRREDIP